MVLDRRDWQRILEANVDQRLVYLQRRHFECTSASFQSLFSNRAKHYGYEVTFKLGDGWVEAYVTEGVGLLAAKIDEVFGPGALFDEKVDHER